MIRRLLTTRKGPPLSRVALVANLEAVSQSPCLVLGVLVAGACRTQAPVAVRVDEPPARSVREVPPAEMRSVIAEEFRLKPDRRFLIAVGEMARLVTDRSPDEVSAEYANGGWRVLSGREEVGSLA